MKILSAEQIRSLDAFTILNEPISSIELMERAAMACVRRLIKLIRSGEEIFVMCGKGNNGGDGLAITRLLNERGFHASAYVIHYTEIFSEDARHNYQALKEKYPGKLMEIRSIEELKSRTPGKNAL